jgi:hypothetical protein
MNIAASLEHRILIADNAGRIRFTPKYCIKQSSFRQMPACPFGYRRISMQGIYTRFNFPQSCFKLWNWGVSGYRKIVSIMRRLFDNPVNQQQIQLPRKHSHRSCRI